MDNLFTLRWGVGNNKHGQYLFILGWGVGKFYSLFASPMLSVLVLADVAEAESTTELIFLS